MKTLLINLTDEQHARLVNFAHILGVAPEELTVAQTFAAFDMCAEEGLWDEWKETEYEHYVQQGLAFRPGNYVRRIYDGVDISRLPAEYSLAAERGIRLPLPPTGINHKKLYHDPLEIPL